MKEYTKKIILDFIMLILFLILYKTSIISLGLHELIGLFLFLVIIIHLVFNKKWIVNTTKKFLKLSKKNRIKYIVDFLLLICFIGITLTGIRISKVLFNFGPCGNFKTLHFFLSAIALILIGIHCGLNWDFIRIKTRNLLKVPKKTAKPVGVIFVIFILIIGTYSLYSTDFGTWISEPLNKDENEQLRHENQQGLQLHDGSGKNNTNARGVKKLDGGGSGVKKLDGTGSGKKKLDGHGSGRANDGDWFNIDSLKFEEIFNFETFNFLEFLITLIKFGSVVGLFAVITHIIELIFIRK